MGLRPAEFAGLTPREFRLLAEGARDRREELEELLAWHAAAILAPWAKGGPLTPARLLGRPTRAMRAKAEGRE